MPAPVLGWASSAALGGLINLACHGNAEAQSSSLHCNFLRRSHGPRVIAVSARPAHGVKLASCGFIQVAQVAAQVRLPPRRARASLTQPLPHVLKDVNMGRCPTVQLQAPSHRRDRGARQAGVVQHEPGAPTKPSKRRARPALCRENSSPRRRPPLVRW